jgi:hypothetical protein
MGNQSKRNGRSYNTGRPIHRFGTPPNKERWQKLLRKHEKSMSEGFREQCIRNAGNGWKGKKRTK